VQIQSDKTKTIEFENSQSPVFGDANIFLFQTQSSVELMEIQLSDIGHLIQLAIAPVFLLTGVGTKLNVLINRLARIIDRSRVLEDRIKATTSGDHADAYTELFTLYRRAGLINSAITLSTSCGLLVCIVIASLFIGDALNVDLGRFIALCFVLGMFSLIGSFVYMLREVFVATKTMSMQRVVPQRR
jgi:hypothetical protein